MHTLADTLCLDSEFGVEQDLPKAGSALEHPLVFDAAARQLKHMAEQGLVQIVSEHRCAPDDDALFDRLRFKRLR